MSLASNASVQEAIDLLETISKDDRIIYGSEADRRIQDTISTLADLMEGKL